jgi:hypothetical protein
MTDDLRRELAIQRQGFGTVLRLSIEKSLKNNESGMAWKLLSEGGGLGIQLGLAPRFPEEAGR